LATVASKGLIRFAENSLGGRERYDSSAGLPLKWSMEETGKGKDDRSLDLGRNKKDQQRLRNLPTSG